MRLSECLDKFIYHCQVKGLQQSSIIVYKDFNKRFIDWIHDCDVNILKYDKVAEYILEMNGSSLSRATVSTYVTHLKIFIRYLEVEEYIKEPFSQKIKKPKANKRILDIYTDEEIKTIYAELLCCKDWINYRNALIISLMLDSGLRLNEVASIKKLDIEKNVLLVHGKGNKERLVPLGKITEHFLNLYVSAVPDHNHGYLLSSPNNQPMSRNAIKLMVNKLSRKLHFNFSPHKLRHNFATNYCIDEYTSRGTVDIYKLMVLLGHEDIATTRRYLHLANQIIISKSNISHLDKIFMNT